MRFVRTMLAVAISASLVMLPLGASAAGSVVSADDTHSSMDAANGMAMDCCPDDMKGAPSHSPDDKCNMGLCCAGGVIALYGARIVSSENPSTAGRKIAIPADQIVSFRDGSPPFRPPRV